MVQQVDGAVIWHVALAFDGAGWHSTKVLQVPKNITLNPVERVWLFLKQWFLSQRLLNNHKAITMALSKAWNRLCR